MMTLVTKTETSGDIAAINIMHLPNGGFLVSTVGADRSASSTLVAAFTTRDELLQWLTASLPVMRQEPVKLAMNTSTFAVGKGASTPAPVPFGAPPRVRQDYSVYSPHDADNYLSQGLYSPSQSAISSQQIRGLNNRALSGMNTITTSRSLANPSLDLEALFRDGT